MSSIPGRDDLPELMKEEVEFQERFRSKLLRYWRALAGATLDEMLRSPDHTATYLQSQDSRMRAVALDILTFYWKCHSEEFAVECERLAIHDPSPVLRRRAVWSLGKCYSRTDDKRIRRLLASVVKNEQEEEEVRAGAYESLLLVRVVRDPQELDRLREVRFLRFPNDVNWGIVDACCSS
jgi:hypothetical protein